MASSLTITNIALSKLGEQPLLDFSDNTVAGRLATRMYDESRLDLLREYPWNFASTRVNLTASAETPAWGFARTFPLPSDFVRLIEIDAPQGWDWNRNDNQTSENSYRVERGKILTDITSPMGIRYVADIADADAMDPLFRETLASKLAWQWAEPLGGTKSLTDQMLGHYQNALQVARVADGQEDQPRKIESCSFINARW